MTLKTDTFQDAVMKLEHTFDDRVLKGGSPMRASVKITNKTKLPIKDVKLALEIDDNGKTWDADICDPQGKVIPAQSVDLGDLAAGSTIEYKYWWKTRYIFGPKQGDFDVTFNLMPHVTVDYDSSQAWQSQARIKESTPESSGSGGVQWSTDKFEDEAIKLEHGFWSLVYHLHDSSYLVSHITITNTTPLPLTNVQIVVDLDDDSAAYDSERCNSSGTLLSIDQVDTPTALGDIMPDKSTPTSYWWRNVVVAGADDGSKKTDYTTSFNIMPYYEVKYSKSNAFRSTSKAVDKI